MKIAILGFGTVGSGIYEIIKNRGKSLNNGSGIEISRILDIRDFGAHEASHLFTKNFEDIIDDNSISVVCEVIGGVEPAFTFSKKALQAGKSVVTSNKELVATRGVELLRIAKENGVSYLFEASVGGAIPVLGPMQKDLAANKITKIMGIVNGTTNYILSRMFDEGQSFENALNEAQLLGYAERNPAADIEGVDTCRKISILSSIAYKKAIKCDYIPTEGITNIDLEDIKYAEKMDSVIKLIGYSEIYDDGVYARVSPMIIKKSLPLSSANGVFNAVELWCDAAGEVFFFGRGAGKVPTASAVMGDVCEIASGFVRLSPWCDGDACDIKNPADITTGVFVRIEKNNCNSLLKEYPNAKEIDIGIEGETGYHIPCITEEKLSQIKAIKFIRTDKSFVI